MLNKQLFKYTLLSLPGFIVGAIFTLEYEHINSSPPITEYTQCLLFEQNNIGEGGAKYKLDSF